MSENSVNEKNKSFLKNKKVLWWVLGVVVGLVLIALVFGFGMRVGALKAGYSCRWYDNFYSRKFGGRNFDFPRQSGLRQGGFLGNLQRFPARDFLGAHGAFGQIVEIKDNSFIIQDLENVEKVIVLDSNTIIVSGRSEKITKDALKVGSVVNVIGEPNEQGEIMARFIRVIK
jgi:hypothetical protein